MENIDDLEWYGFDLQAPHAGEDELSTIVVDDVDIELPEDVAEHLSRDINPLAESIDLYMEALSIFTT